MAKVISISTDESQLILQAKNQNRLAQKSLFDNYSGKMLSVCRYYIHDVQFAEDVMIKGFFKAFTKLESYNRKSSFYTWLKSIMTNECIDFLRSKTHKLQFADWNETYEPSENNLNENYDLQALQQLIDELPDGCKIVFNLYVLEDLKHKEIAEILGISEGTSRSQLSFAREKLKEKISQNIRNHV